MTSDKEKPSYRVRIRSWRRKHFPRLSSKNASSKAGETSRTKPPASREDPSSKFTSSETDNEPRQSPTKGAAAPSAADEGVEGEVEAEAGASKTLEAALPGNPQPSISRSLPAFPTTTSTPPAPDLSHEAFSALPRDTQDEVKKLIPTANPGGLATSVHDEINVLVNIVEGKQKQCEAKFWKIKVFDTDFVIRDYVKITLAVLKGVGDVAIQFAPAPGSAVWSGVKTLMEVSL